ncbi:nucleoside deaminase [Tardiphaga alba]|uniref:Nucleoside deaminase n=1 Tax=Tardiphaga alba TaxID=340268 RepID=A0ABX8ACR1_9BRAD|nr:nucleoside deaminase [Tardiphaga alba]QUS40188.1 nucleoside deaminase [Tardiphaga alba]
MTSSSNGDTSLDKLFASARVVHRRQFLAAGAGGVIAASAGTEAFAKPASPVASGTEEDKKFMAQAIEQMRKAGVVERTGGPFGAVIVRNGEVLAVTGNSVLRDNDPSAHAEVNAIRAACKKVGAPNLKGATMYTSCECCPMCYATAYWARLDRIVFAAAWTDYADLFDDSNISADMKLPYSKRKLKIAQVSQADAQKVWQEFRKLPDRAKY